MLYEDILYHRARASQELSRGRACSSLAAARAHLQLSSLHRERAKALLKGLGGAGPGLALA